MKKVVITGMSLMSILANDKKGHQDIIKLDQMPENKFPISYWDNYFDGEVGSIPFFEPKEFIKNPKSIKFMSRQTILGCTAVAQVIRDAEIDDNQLQKKQFENSLIWGAGVSDSIFPLLPAVIDCIRDDGCIDYKSLGEDGYRNLPPLWILKKLPNTTAGQISVQNCIRGLNYTVVNGPLSGILAFSMAFEHIQSCRSNFTICGAAEERTHSDYIYYLKEKGVISLSTNGLMPFDEQSDGGYIAEGASAFILEDEDSACERGARVYAQVLACSNRYLPHFTDSGYEYAALKFEKCMRTALENAGITAEDIDFIQTSACGDKRLDFPEALAIRSIFGNKVPITSCSSYSGYTLGASGVVSLSYAIMQMEQNLVLPMRKTENKFLEDELNYVVERLQRHKNNYVLINSFSYMGDACSVVLKRGGVK
ncbi:beta-ketoacyl synthase N-terminal-like domain-containing protein [Ruminiclostridium cellulolyticum]|uniref:Beta-ketoacyl synthase n=1 Tax=Ruminiclostridium cellulolyticum (strain ATCC 35319 / DSM 5812 / JCM 6584 / H10) TaxID=394503 RepID=B8I8K6_RUMCH|nr:beta-ketoacyl synthase N-terminal-like domain-containing protein [Ruminiclostridium cellulolyticum]ACL75239.1 Beta-ketoacyl synthase [Ruminiclostridium cellulolyticum H10]